jgi:hypothetical protein
MQSVLLRRVAQPNDHLFRSLSERSADFVNDTAAHTQRLSQCEYPIQGRHDVVDWLQKKSGQLATHTRKQREIYTPADPSVKESVMPPKMCSGPFKATDSLKSCSIMQGKNLENDGQRGLK